MLPAFNFANQNQMLCFNIPITNDLICEDTEVLIVFLTPADLDVTICTPSTTTVTIEDDDGGLSMI